MRPSRRARPVRAKQRTGDGGGARAGARLWLLGLMFCVGCASYSDKVRDARSALDAGRPRDAIASFNKRLGVETEKDLPDDIRGEKVLYLLERSVALQSVSDYAHSSRDLEVADKQVEVLDFTHSTLDDISKFMFSDDSGPYQSPAYEKLMINTLNMINYLVRADLNGARVEARRLATMQKFISDSDPNHAGVGATGSYLAGFTFEKSREPSEALRFYDEALQHNTYSSLIEPVAQLAKADGYRSEQIKQILAKGSPSAEEPAADSAEILVVVGYGRVPAKIAQRIPIGLALTLASGDLSPASRARANQLAAQGLVTWINFPTLPKPGPVRSTPVINIDQQPVAPDGTVPVDQLAVDAWRETKGKMIASAITRVITRVVAGEVTKKATGGGAIGFLASLGAQATLTATDTPDTRSWSTLPARLAVARIRVPAGKHVVDISVSGERKQQTLDLKPGGWAAVNLTVLR
jgi:uncharacterized protein